MKKLFAGLFILGALIFTYNIADACSKGCDCGCTKGKQCTCIKDEKGNIFKPEIVCPSKFRDKPEGCERNLGVVTLKSEHSDGVDSAEQKD